MPPLRILVQCSIPFVADDWHIGRFSALLQTLRSLQGPAGEPLAEVVGRNRTPDASGRDPVLATLDTTRSDELWLLAGDGGQALDDVECAAIDAFQRAGGGVLTARDHQDMGLWLRKLQGVGQAHFFHDETYREVEQSRWSRDDADTGTIDFPNYHSGANGDFQRIVAVEPAHPLLRRGPGERIEFLPAHPHEGAVGPPANDTRARSVARGKSVVTGRSFDLVVAFERGEEFRGRGVAESSFHHFADYNWDPSAGAPSFVVEPQGRGMREHPQALRDTQAYVRNLVEWLAPRSRLT